MAVTSANEIWIVNRGAAAIDLEAGELFGFGLGAYVEAQSGRMLPKSFKHVQTSIRTFAGSKLA